MAIVTGDRYLDLLANFLDRKAEALLDGSLLLKLNPVGLLYLQSRLTSLAELESLRSDAPVDYLRAYMADLGDHRKLEKLRQTLTLLEQVKVVALLRGSRDPTPVCLLPFSHLRELELRGCDISRTPPRGLFALQHQLERITVIDCASALRHIFVERTVDVKKAEKWGKLVHVACPGNGMVLMDESLTLLPGVHTLDLSGNAFSEVAALHGCTALRELNLGSNRLTSVSSMNLGLRHLRQLVLRGNLLATTRGLEGLPALEGLDLALNMLSSLQDIARLRHLSNLGRLCLKGNPITFMRGFRARVLSLFPQPQKIELDGTRSNRWERHQVARYARMQERDLSQATTWLLLEEEDSKSDQGFDAPTQDARPAVNRLSLGRPPKTEMRLEEGTVEEAHNGKKLESPYSEPAILSPQEQQDFPATDRWQDVSGHSETGQLSMSSNSGPRLEISTRDPAALLAPSDVSQPTIIIPDGVDRVPVPPKTPDLPPKLAQLLLRAVNRWETAGTPPHFEVDVLRRRQGLENELLLGYEGVGGPQTSERPDKHERESSSSSGQESDSSECESDSGLEAGDISLDGVDGSIAQPEGIVSNGKDVAGDSWQHPGSQILSDNKPNSSSADRSAIVGLAEFVVSPGQQSRVSPEFRFSPSSSWQSLQGAHGIDLDSASPRSAASADNESSGTEISRLRKVRRYKHPGRYAGSTSKSRHTDLPSTIRPGLVKTSSPNIPFSTPSTPLGTRGATEAPLLPLRVGSEFDRR